MNTTLIGTIIKIHSDIADLKAGMQTIGRAIGVEETASGETVARTTGHAAVVNQSERMRAIWASYTPQQRAARIRKQRAGLAKRGKKGK